jgi:hypothetical protein
MSTYSDTKLDEFWGKGWRNEAADLGVIQTVRDGN